MDGIEARVQKYFEDEFIGRNVIATRERTNAPAVKVEGMCVDLQVEVDLNSEMVLTVQFADDGPVTEGQNFLNEENQLVRANTIRHIED